MTDESELAEAMISFLAEANRLAVDHAIEFADVMFPSGAGPGIGSELGRDLWASDAGSHLAAVALRNKEIARWAKPPPSSDFTELRRAVAMFTGAWASSQQSPADFVSANILGFLSWIVDIHPICHGFLIIQGASVAKPIQLLEGIQLLPGDSKALNNLPNLLPISRKEVFRLPDRPTIFALGTLRSDRSAWGGIAGTMAMGWCRVRLQGLGELIWLATGHIPTLCDEFFWEESPFATIGLDHFAATPQARYRKTEGVGQVEDNEVLAVQIRQWAFFGDDDRAIEEATWLSLWMARSYVHAILDQVDPLFGTLLGYAALDGLFRDPEEDDGILGPRIAELVGSNAADAREIRGLLAKVRDIRGVAAHGRRPLLIDVARAHGRSLTQEEIEANPFGLRERVYDELANVFLALLRRSFLAYLWLAVPTADWPDRAQAPSVAAGLTRKQMFELIDSARKNDELARERILLLVPDLARGV